MTSEGRSYEAMCKKLLLVSFRNTQKQLANLAIQNLMLVVTEVTEHTNTGVVVQLI